MKTTLLMLIGSAILAAGSPSRAKADSITVAAAISLKDALNEVARAYRTDTGVDVQLTFASSGQLMAQIRSGAPIDLFISAATRQVDQLAMDKLIDPATRRVVAGNALVLLVPVGAKAPPQSFSALADPRHARVAMGDPRTVPAGEYAAQVLEALKITATVRDRTVYGSNVRQVLDYVERGEVSAGIVYRTDALQSGPKVRVVDRADPATHSPIVYPAAVVSGSKKADAARRFLDYLAGEKAQKVLAAKGFSPPPAPASGGKGR